METPPDIPPTPATPDSDGSGLPAIAPDAVEEVEAGGLDDVVPTRGGRMLPMVALGGSAGSIEALKKFFEVMPADSGMAFAVIIHLAPEHDSILDEILGRATTMRVVQPCDGEKVLANTVYVIPAGKILSLTDGHLKVTRMEEERGKRVAVDIFFRTLADTHGPHATAIVLSGADGDGALGIKRIKERGGLTIAQDPDEAEYAVMPRSAMDTGMVDWVLPVADMPSRLLQYLAQESKLALPAEDGPQPGTEPAQESDEQEKALREVLAFLRLRTGRDFSYYRRATIVRRISRRMQVCGANNMSEYLAFLRMHPGEAAALQQDLLISVTNFFRDREAFEALEKRIPALLEGKDSTHAIRVWVAACATGEEAYSIAMLLLEHAALMKSPPAIQVFATDLDEDAITIAREALYPLTISADVSEDRLRRFFSREHRGYRARRELRERVLFAVHDLLKDSPFSRLDLISCRNLLIYLSREAQLRALQTFHFALRPEGLLFLGTSETAEEDGAAFLSLDKKHRIYKPFPVRLASWAFAVPDGVTRETMRGRSTGRTFIHGPTFFGQNTAQTLEEAERGRARDVSWESLHFQLLERLAPPSLIVTRDYAIVHVSENAKRFLQFASGEPTVDLLRLIHPMLRVELRAALFRAAQGNVPVEAFRVPVTIGGVTKAIDIRVVPAQDVAPDHLLVIFAERETADSITVQKHAEAEPAVRHIERELEQMKTRLRDTVEQYEASTEELKASNEELQAMNEEMRSTTEELEASREELQSMNEELTTVNQELKDKVDSLDLANSDLANFMAASSIATVIVDRRLRIKRYTPSAVSLFRLIATDVGRPLMDVAHRLRYADLEKDVERVLATLIPVKREVADGAGRSFLAEILPYRTAEDQIAGAVLSFVDITEIRETEHALRESQERLRLILENARDYAIISMDAERRITSWNAGAETILGYTAEEVMHQSADLIFTPEDRAAGVPEQEARKALAEGRATDERWHICKNGERFWGSGVMMAMHDAGGNAAGLVKIFRDHTPELCSMQALEEALRETQKARAEAEAATRAKDHFLAVLSHELRTPLTPVTVALEILKRNKDLQAPVREALEMIGRNIQIEARIVDDLLDVTRITRGKLEIVREEIDIHEVIKDAVDIVRSDVDGKSQTVAVALGAKESRLWGDKMRLQQMLWNVLKNASKFTPVDGEIAVHTRNERGRIVIEVTDNGIGIEAEALARIFDPFEQADESVTREFGGLGLGLAIGKATVDAHGGTMHARSAGQGTGATIAIELPLDLGPVPGGTRPSR